MCLGIYIYICAVQVYYTYRVTIRILEAISFFWDRLKIKHIWNSNTEGGSSVFQKD